MSCIAPLPDGTFLILNGAHQGVAGFGLGAVTALMSKEAAMTCTEAVETVIGEHYDEYVFSRLTPRK